MPDQPLMPGQIPGYESSVREGVPPESPAGQDVDAGPSPAGETPTERLADGSDPKEAKVPYERFKEVSAEAKAASARVEELESVISSLTEQPEFKQFFSGESATATTPPTAPQAPAQQPEAEGDEFSWFDERISKVVNQALNPLKQHFAYQEQTTRQQHVQRQLEGLGQIIPDFDTEREKAVMAQAIEARRKNGIDATDAYLLAHKADILRALAERNSGQQGGAPRGGTGHDLGGAPVTAGPDSPDELLRKIETLPPGIEKDRAAQAYLQTFMQKQGLTF